MTRYEHILQTLEGLHPSDLMYLWNDRCTHNKYYTDYIRSMDDFDELERPIDPDLTISEQIESIQINFEHFDIHDKFYNRDVYDHYYSFNDLEAKDSPFDMKELAKDIDEYADDYYHLDTIGYIDDFEWLYEQLIETF